MVTDMPGEVLARPKPRRSKRWPLLLAVAFIAFLLGGGAVGWLAWHERFHPADIGLDLPGLGPRTAAVAPHPAVPPAALAPSPGAGPHDLNSDEARIAALEQRLSRIDAQANAEEANTARAEALLVAFAARRAVERGAPLGYLEGQIKLRFGTALPDATAIVIAADKNPVTSSQLSAWLQAIGPTLTASPQTANMWGRVRNEFNDLFMLRRQTKVSASPEARLDHALLSLREGRIGDAIADVQRLPDAKAAQSWIQAASHYAQVEQALDQLETVALQEPRELKDSAGHPVSGATPGTPAPQNAPLSPTPAHARPGTPGLMNAHHSIWEHFHMPWSHQTLRETGQTRGFPG